MQISNRILGNLGNDGRLAAALKDADSPFQHRPLPLVDPCQMNLMSGRQFRHHAPPFRASNATRADKAAPWFPRFDISVLLAL